MEYSKFSVCNIKTMQPVAIIENPCSQPWQEMTPQGTGRHCRHCSKMVTDFTTWSDDEILRYLSAHSNVCGRFRKEQVADDDTSNYLRSVARAHVPLLHKIAAAIALVFGLLQMSCTMGASSADSHHLTGDSVAVTPVQTFGEPTLPSDSVTKGKLIVADSPVINNRKHNIVHDKK